MSVVLYRDGPFSHQIITLKEFVKSLEVPLSASCFEREDPLELRRARKTGSYCMIPGISVGLILAFLRQFESYSSFGVLYFFL